MMTSDKQINIERPLPIIKPINADTVFFKEISPSILPGSQSLMQNGCFLAYRVYNPDSFMIKSCLEMNLVYGENLRKAIAVLYKGIVKTRCVLKEMKSIVWFFCSFVIR